MEAVRLVLAILLLVPMLTGTLCPAALPAGDLADDSAATACCGQTGEDGDREGRDGHAGCDGGCSACCKVRALAPVLPSLSRDLAEAGQFSAAPERVVLTRRVEAPLRPPRFPS